jgi:hypothetical protein
MTELFVAFLFFLLYLFFAAWEVGEPAWYKKLAIVGCLGAMIGIAFHMMGLY